MTTNTKLKVISSEWEYRKALLEQAQERPFDFGRPMPLSD